MTLNRPVVQRSMPINEVFLSNKSGMIFQHTVAVIAALWATSNILLFHEHSILHLVGSDSLSVESWQDLKFLRGQWMGLFTEAGSVLSKGPSGRVKVSTPSEEQYIRQRRAKKCHNFTVDRQKKVLFSDESMWQISVRNKHRADSILTEEENHSSLQRHAPRTGQTSRCQTMLG